MARRTLASSNNKRLKDLGRPKPNLRLLAIRTLLRVWHGKNNQRLIRSIRHTTPCPLRSCHQPGQTNTAAILLPRERKPAPTWRTIQMEARCPRRHLQLKKASSNPKNLVDPLPNSWSCLPGSDACNKSMTIIITLRRRRTLGYASSASMK